MFNSYGMAIKITKENREKISIVGTSPIPELCNNETSYYFIFPYDYNTSAEILYAKEFFETYEFANLEDETCFVDIIKL